MLWRGSDTLIQQMGEEERCAQEGGLSRIAGSRHGTGNDDKSWAQDGHANAQSAHTVLDMLSTLLHVTQELQAPFDACDIDLIFRINTHLIFHGLIGVNYRAVVASSKVQADCFEG